MPLAALKLFDEVLPEEGESDAATLALLDDVGSPAAIGMAGPRFFGFVIGGALPASVASNWLTTAWDQNACMHEVTPAASRLEGVALQWLVDVLGLPAGTGAGFVTGTTVANFSALAAARHKVLTDAGWDVEANGLIGAPEVTIIVGGEAHPTLTKSLGLLGFGRNRVTRVAVDDQGRMITSQLPSISGPTIICTQAGNVNTGAFDPSATSATWRDRMAHGCMSMVHSVFGLLRHVALIVKHRGCIRLIRGRQMLTRV